MNIANCAGRMFALAYEFENRGRYSSSRRMIWGFGRFWALTLYVSRNPCPINLLISTEPLLSYTDTKDRQGSLVSSRGSPGAVTGNNMIFSIMKCYAGLVGKECLISDHRN
jgi:hypothetical protein